MELPTYAYFQGKIVPYGQAKVGVLTHSLNYGTAAFGGLRAYWNADAKKLYLFRPLDHFKRFLNSARLLRMEFEHTPESLTAVTLELIRKEGYQRDIYIRPLAYKADEIIGVRLHDLHDEISIVAVPFDRYMANDDHAHLTISSWRRVDDNMIPARGKISGAYANSSFIKTDAHEGGYDEALVLTQDGHISEGSAMNFFMVKDGKLVTPPVTDNILEGITRRTLMDLARDELGLQIVERSIDRTEVYLCEEVILAGTGAQVVVATHIDHRPIGDGKMGPVGSRLRELYNEVVRGCYPKYMPWLVEV
jgi:branched-chain amino acid aminotransferase